MHLLHDGTIGQILLETSKPWHWSLLMMLNEMKLMQKMKMKKKIWKWLLHMNYWKQELV